MTEQVMPYAVDDVIVTVRGQKAILDSDLAALYGVATKVLNQAVRRNARRFPPEFAFPLTRQEVSNLKSQIVTSSRPASDSPALAGCTRTLRRYRYTGEVVSHPSI